MTVIFMTDIVTHANHFVGPFSMCLNRISKVCYPEINTVEPRYNDVG